MNAVRVIAESWPLVDGRPVRQAQTMIDHLGINCADVAASAAFYDEVLGTLGHSRLMDFGVAIGYGTTTPAFWLSSFEEDGSQP